MDNYRAMAIFAQVIEYGSFSAAARKLGITASAVSQQINQLEDVLGTRLLHRTTRQLNLTEEGKIYLDGCRQMLDAADLANQRIGQFSKEPSGTLKISCSHDFSASHLVPLLGPFMDRHPKLSLDVDGSDEVVNLVEEQVDLALRIGHLEESGWISRKIGELQEIIVAAPSYLDRQGTPGEPADLAHHQWVAFTRKRQPYQLRLSGPNGDQYKVRLYGRAHSNSAPSMQEMIKAGLGVGQTLRLNVMDELENGELIQVLSDYRSEPVGIYAVYPQRAFLPLKVRAVIDYLIENKKSLGV
ncbi:MAG: LysR family transcriptional regulator [Desulfuromonas sp.]|nr:MAG: LysR family transcriptional regulator [Desulfuromonas sp.]